MIINESGCILDRDGDQIKHCAELKALKCDTCGWNIAEHKKRMNFIRFIGFNGRRHGLKFLDLGSKKPGPAEVPDVENKARNFAMRFVPSPRG